jgi:hypothetical protein
VNIGGLTVREKAETFWTPKTYELALEFEIKHFVFGNLDYGLRKGNYDPKYRTGPYDGKGRTVEWLLHQHSINNGKPFYHMKITILTTSPYIEITIAAGTPMAPQVEKGEKGGDVVFWRVPLTEEGAVLHVLLGDCAFYVHWLFDHPERADGIDLEVAVEHAHYTDLAAAFQKMTGNKAGFIDTLFEEYWTSGPLSPRAVGPAGIEAEMSDPGTMIVKDNFTGFLNL